MAVKHRGSILASHPAPGTNLGSLYFLVCEQYPSSAKQRISHLQLLVVASRAKYYKKLYFNVNPGPLQELLRSRQVAPHGCVVKRGQGLFVLVVDQGAILEEFLFDWSSSSIKNNTK